MATAAVRVTDLVKVFPKSGGGELRAVDGVSFEVRQGEVFGFLGPNGAGKTTTLEIVEGLQEPTSGEVEVLGIDMLRNGDAAKTRIGVQLQASAYFDHLRLEEILDLFAVFYEVEERAEELLAIVGLLDKRKALVKQLSGGQENRFSIAASLVNDPEILFLDEPTSGLDPQGRANLWDIVGGIKERGKTVVVTTHYMEEAEDYCDRVAIIDHGQIKALDTPLALIQALDSAYHVRFVTTGAVPEDRLRSLPGAIRLTRKEGNGARSYDLEVHDAAKIIGPLGTAMSGIDMVDFRVEPSTLDDVFLALTGRELRD